MFKPHKTFTLNWGLTLYSSIVKVPSQSHTHVNNNHTHVQISPLETAAWNWQEQHRDSICKLFWLPRHHVLAAFYLYQIGLHHRDGAQRQQVCCQRHLRGHTNVFYSNVWGCESQNTVLSPTWLSLGKHNGCSFNWLFTTNCDKISQTRHCRAYHWYTLLCLLCGAVGLLLN